jgi:hypothetical protein
MSDAPDFALRPEHALELGEMLEFIADWLRADRRRLAASLARFVGSDAYRIDELAADLERFAFLFGADPARFWAERS